MAFARVHMVAGTLPLVVANHTYRLALRESLERKLQFPYSNMPPLWTILTHIRQSHGVTEDYTDPLTEKGYITRENGLQYKDVRKGTGDQTAEIYDEVKLRYQQYDEEKGRYKHPDDDVITLGKKHDYGQGIDEGIRGMKCDGTRTLIIPHYLIPESDRNNTPNKTMKSMPPMASKTAEPKHQIYEVTLVNVMKRELEA